MENISKIDIPKLNGFKKVTQANEYSKIWNETKFIDREDPILSDELTINDELFKNAINVIDKFNEEPDLLKEISINAWNNYVRDKIDNKPIEPDFVEIAEEYGADMDYAEQVWEAELRFFKDEMEKYEKIWKLSDRDSFIQERYSTEVETLQKFYTTSYNLAEKRLEFVYNLAEKQLESIKNISKDLGKENNIELKNISIAKQENTQPTNIRLGDKFIFDNKPYEVYHIREQHDPKIYLEHTAEDGIRDELTYYQSDIVKALKENKIEMIDKRELIENEVTNHDIIKMWADKPEQEQNKEFNLSEFLADVKTNFSAEEKAYLRERLLINFRQNEFSPITFQKNSNISKEGIEKVENFYNKFKQENYTPVSEKDLKEYGFDYASIYVDKNFENKVDDILKAMHYDENIRTEINEVYLRIKKKYISNEQINKNIMKTTEQKSVQGWDEYQFDLNQPLTTKDVYAFLGKGGTPESISTKMSELFGQQIVIPRYIKNQDLWAIVKPFRDLTQDKQTELKNYLVNFLSKNEAQVRQQKSEETPKEKMLDFTNFYANEYEIKSDKGLNKHDILAFYLQYGKGAQKKLLELTENFLGHPIHIEKRTGEEFESNIVNPILERGVFASTEFKNILIENLESQKIFREQSQLEGLKSTFLFCEKDKKVYAIEHKDSQIEVKGVGMLQENAFKKTFETINAFNEWKDSIAAAPIKKHNYEIGDEFVFKMEGVQNIFTLVEKNEHKENSLLDSFVFKTGEGEEVKQDRFYRIDVEILVAQNKAKQVTPEMKANGILFEKDYGQFHFKHLTKINPNTGLTDKNIYAIINTKMGDTLSETRKNVLEKYFNVPFDELKKFKKDQMIDKIYAIKKGENKQAEFELKSEIQKLFLQSKGETNSIAPQAYEQYLQSLSYPEKGVWELEHIDKLLTEENDILSLVENTPLENDKMCSNILEQFNDNREFILHSPSFHMGVEQIEAKQYLLNAINHSEDKELIKSQLLENIEDNNQKQTYQLKR